MAYILHGIPVRGYVIYIGEDKMNMPNQLCHESLNYSFTLIDLTDLSPEEFLSSDVPEEVMLAILAGKSRGEEKRSVIQKVLSKLRLLLKEDEATLSRRLTQLEILGELRSIQQLIIKEEQTMALTYNLEKDIRYRQGLEAGVEKGIEKKTRNFIQSLLIKTKLSLQEIADIAGVSVDFVKTIKKQ
jgi:hypothetical protein